MYSLLIVDDEKIAREDLKNCIDWNRVEIGQIWEAGNGRQALDIILMNDPDIVLLDIRMPVMDGIELLEKLNEKRIENKVIIVSGYKEFEYAKKALKMGVVDYILKPVQEDQLVEVVSKCISIIEEENKKKSEYLTLKDDLEKKNKIIESRLILNYILGNVLVEQEDIFLNDFLLRYDVVQVLVSVIKLANVSQSGWIKEKEEAVYSLVENFFLNRSDKLLYSIYKIEDDLLVLFFMDNKNRTNNLKVNVLSQFYELLEILPEEQKKSLVIGTGKEYSSFQDLNLSYREAVVSCQYGVISNAGGVFDIEFLGLNNTCFTDYKVYVKKIKSLICSGDKPDVDSVLKDCIKTLCFNELHFDLNQIKLFFIYLIDNIIDDFESFKHNIDSVSFINSKNSIEEIYQGIRTVLNNIYDYVNMEKGNQKRFIVDLAKKYILEHYYKKITLNDVAGYVYVNPSYFSKIFSEETGQSFSEYVTKLRIEKAKQLLNERHLRVYEIAEQSGYKDIKHFLKTFKEVEGITPTQYRESRLLNEHIV